MCCFSQPVLSVNDTRIFARASGRGTQFLAYQMAYESLDENAMILPLPIKQPARDNSLSFIDLEEYATFFDELATGFPYHAPPGIGCSATKDSVSGEVLKVFEVGNYIASFVPSAADFGRLDPKFILPEEVWARMPGYNNFGFAVFQLAAGALKPHPMALEFETENDDLFFPTVHIHDGEVHESEEFDHVLYMQHAGLDSRVHGYKNSDVEDRSTGLMRSKYPASQFCDVNKSEGIIDGNLLLHRKIMRGTLPNKDSIFSIAGDPVRPSFNFRRLLPYAPWLLAISAIGWFFNRRTRIKNIKESKSAETSEEFAE